jgi:cytochrome c556
MRLKLRQVVSFLAAAVVVTGLVSAGTAADDKKAPSTKQIMKACTGKNGLCAKTVSLAKDGKWDDAQKSATELKDFGAALAAGKYKKGDAESWKKLTTKFAEQTAAVADAAGKKDAKAVGDAAGAFAKSCKECHDAHK